jgi:hypothetical protein
MHGRNTVQLLGAIAGKDVRHARAHTKANYQGHSRHTGGVIHRVSTEQLLEWFYLVIDVSIVYLCSQRRLYHGQPVMPERSSGIEHHLGPAHKGYQGWRVGHVNAHRLCPRRMCQLLGGGEVPIRHQDTPKRATPGQLLHSFAPNTASAAKHQYCRVQGCHAVIPPEGLPSSFQANPGTRSSHSTCCARTTLVIADAVRVQVYRKWSAKESRK